MTGVPHGRTTAADGAVLVDRDDRIVTVTLNRPDKLNAFSPSMFTALEDFATGCAADPTVRLVVFRGAGGRALAAGADIAAFTSFTAENTDVAVAYEAGVVRAVSGVQRLPQVTLAVIEGLAVGGGLALATACDLRIATTGARIGYPIAATLGNCLSAAVLSRCVAVFGEALVRHLLLTAELVDVQRAYQLGAISAIADPAALDAEVAALAEGIVHLAPGTQLGTKRILDALADGEDPDDESVIRSVYGSDDFLGAVRAFLTKQRPTFAAVLPL